MAQNPSSRSRPKARKDPDKISVAEAEKRIQAYVNFIQSRSEAMTAEFYYSGAAATLSEAFASGGVHESMPVADSWGKMGVGLTWSQAAKEFYAYHIDALNASLQVIRTQRYATKSDMSYLDDGMRRWKDYEQKFPRLFQELISHYVEEALLLDEKAAYGRTFQQELDRLSPMRPYPSGRIDALNAEMYARNREFDARKQPMEDAQDHIQRMIQEHASTRLFSPIQEGLVTSTIE